MTFLGFSKTILAAIGNSFAFWMFINLWNNPVWEIFYRLVHTHWSILCRICFLLIFWELGQLPTFIFAESSLFFIITHTHIQMHPWSQWEKVCMKEQQKNTKRVNGAYIWQLRLGGRGENWGMWEGASSWHSGDPGRLFKGLCLCYHTQFRASRVMQMKHWPWAQNLRK